MRKTKRYKRQGASIFEKEEKTRGATIKLAESILGKNIRSKEKKRKEKRKTKEKGISQKKEKEKEDSHAI